MAKRIRHWSAEIGSQGLEAAGVALAAALIVAGLLAILPSFNGQLGQIEQCVVAIISGGGNGACGGARPAPRPVHRRR